MSKNACWPAAFLFLMQTGCLIPYAYPHATIIPPVQLPPEQADVRAFRVDFTSHWADMVIHPGGEFVLSEVPVSAKGVTHTQAALNIDYGYYVFGIALNYPVHNERRTFVRLYCPGFELQQVHSALSAPQVVMVPALTIESQEKAVDDLLSHSYVPVNRDYGDELANITPGSAAPAHRQALLFAASEYERLAVIVKDSASKERLGNNSKILRDLAAK